MSENIKSKPVRGVIVQCRLSSTRLPNKALYLLDSKPLLLWTLEAMKKVPADYYIVATDEASADGLLPVCNKAGFDCFVGPLDDVLERFCMVVQKYNIDTVIRGTGDNPYLFWEAAAESADDFDSLRGTEEACDYLTYSGLPHGSGVEIFDGKALIKAGANTKDPYDHEHAGPAFYRHQDKFKCVFKKAPEKYYAPHLRTTVDTYADFIKAELIVRAKKRKDKIEQIEEPLETSEIMEFASLPEIQRPLVLCPSTKCGRGTGHLVRCLNLARECGCFIHIPSPKVNSIEEVSFTNKIAELVSLAIDKGLDPNQILPVIPEKGSDFIYLADTFALEKEEAEYLSASTLIALDDSSAYRDLCDYVLDIIPSLKNDYKANLRKIDFLELPPKNNKQKIVNIEDIKKVLVCFGGEDPAELAIPVTKKCISVFPEAKITCISSRPIILGENVNVLPSIPDLKNHLCEYDLVITHYGLTAFESLSSGTGVLLFPTTKLHKKLSIKYGFACCSIKSFKKSLIQNFLNNGKIFNEHFFEQNIPSSNSEIVQKTFPDFVNILSLGKTYHCPVCGKIENEKFGKVISRNETRTYRKCPDCGMVYISFSCFPETKYEKEYFFESYKNQYGKTYKEDFENIKASCVKRIKEINKIMPPVKDSKVLDVGCAYGPFLAASSENGWIPYGTDICEDAVLSIQKELGFKACVSAFPEIDTEKEFGIKEFDAVTMWYVIEHFQNLNSVLKKVSSLIKRGGVFAFSTPSGEGVSAKTDKDHFYNISPTDHYSVWEPSKAERILKRFGFKIVRIVSTGHHPERFQEIKKNGVKPGSPEWEKVMNRSVKKNLGDTVEIYCIKI